MGSPSLLAGWLAQQLAELLTEWLTRACVCVCVWLWLCSLRPDSAWATTATAHGAAALALALRPGPCVQAGRYLILEVHINNPSLLVNVPMTLGVRLYMTSTTNMRQYYATSLITGALRA